MQSTIWTAALLCVLWPFCVMCSETGMHRPSKISTGPCEYAQIKGRAVITAVRQAPAGAYNCRQAVEILFTFVPDDPSAKDTYILPREPDSGRHFTVGAGLNPPGGWARRVGLVQGSTHRCVRQEIVKGACTPVVFSFPDLDLTGWEAECFNRSAP